LIDKKNDQEILIDIFGLVLRKRKISSILSRLLTLVSECVEIIRARERERNKERKRKREREREREMDTSGRKMYSLEIVTITSRRATTA
jgi:hypothetical protein